MADDSCLFCAIVDGEIPSRTVFSGDETLAFLDVNPIAPGHTLVVPTAHHERLQDLPEAVNSGLWSTVHRLVPAIEAAVEADATNIGINNGRASGQEIPHAHVHVVPRFSGDGGGSIHSVAGSPPSLDDAALDEIAEAIEHELA